MGKIVVDEIWEVAYSLGPVYLLPNCYKISLVTISASSLLSLSLRHFLLKNSKTLGEKNLNSLIWHSRPSTNYFHNLLPFTQSMLQEEMNQLLLLRCLLFHSCDYSIFSAQLFPPHIFASSNIYLSRSKLILLLPSSPAGSNLFFFWIYIIGYFTYVFMYFIFTATLNTL